MRIDKEQYERLVKTAQLLEDLEFFNCIDYNKYNIEQEKLSRDLKQLDTQQLEDDHLYENL